MKRSIAVLAALFLLMVLVPARSRPQARPARPDGAPVAAGPHLEAGGGDGKARAPEAIVQPIALGTSGAPVLRDRNVNAFFHDRGVAIGIVSGSRGWGLHWGMTGAQPVTPRPTGELAARIHSFVGESSRWKVDQPAYSCVEYAHARPGVDLLVEARPHGLKYTLRGIVERALRLRYEGATEVRAVDEGSALEVVTDLGRLREDGLICWQDGRRLASRYVVTGADEYAIEIYGHDASRPVDIDPTISWSSFVGGTVQPHSATPEWGQAIAVDSTGSVLVAGFGTYSVDFPAAGGFDTTFNGGVYDAFVAKVGPSGSGLTWCTFLGGSSTDEAYGIAVDGDGSVYVTGEAGSSDFPATTSLGGGTGYVAKIAASGASLLWSVRFGSSQDYGRAIAVDASGNAYVTGQTLGSPFPVTAGAYDTSFNGNTDAFVFMLDASGTAMVWSSYLGGSGFDEGYGVAIDGSGNVYVTGNTSSSNFPALDGFDSTLTSTRDAFVTKFASGGASVAWSSFLGGSAADYGRAIAVDASGNAYVTGYTNSTDFPAVAAFDWTPGFNSNAFVAKVAASGAGLIWSTYLGGNGNDEGFGIAVDAAGFAFVTGFTESYDFPTTAGAYDTSANGTPDLFVTKFNPDGASLAWSTYVGGMSQDRARSLALDAAGNVYLTGDTSSADYPVPGGFDTNKGGNQDAFVTKLDASGASLGWSSYFGGGLREGNDSGQAIAIDGSGNVYIAGQTYATDFPTAGGFDATLGGTFDGFVAKIAASGGSLVWSSYVGGSNEDYVYGLAADAAGNVFLTGSTRSSDFPLLAGFDVTLAGQDAFVMKINASGSSIAWSTLLGGVSSEAGHAIALDGSGDVYVTGQTLSYDFPVPGGFDPSNSGGIEAFVAKVNASGASLAWSSYLGGLQNDAAYAIAVDLSGAVFVTGYTESADFPSTGGFDVTLGGATDAFVTKIDASGSTLAWSTYLGGSGNDYGRGVAVDPAGSAFVIGHTLSSDFPLSAAFDAVLGGTQDAFVTKLTGAGGLAFSSYLGGGGFDYGNGVAVDGGGNAYVAGYTNSGDFPSSGGFDTTFGGIDDGFVACIGAAGPVLAWSSYLGGSADDRALGIAATGGGDVCITGSTQSDDFPTSGGFDVIRNGDEAFVTRIGASRPAGPASIVQLKSDAVTPIATGGWTNETSVVVRGTVSDPAGEGVKLQVEVRPLGAAFVGSPTSESAMVLSGMNADVAVSGFSPGTYYHWQARTVDVSGMASAWVSFGGNAESAADFGVDTSAPTAGTVRDGTGSDIDSQSSATTINANWSGFADAQSGVAGYQWAIGTSPGATNTQGWTSAGLATSATNSSLTLARRTTYYVAVRATNGAGLQTTATSDGVRVK